VLGKCKSLPNIGAANTAAAVTVARKTMSFMLACVSGTGEVKSIKTKGREDPMDATKQSL
jgi:hypothetical protein